jgi:hypothetical protein
MRPKADANVRDKLTDRCRHSLDVYKKPVSKAAVCYDSSEVSRHAGVT